MCEDKVRPGCVCAEHMYRDENGDCVTMDECNKCYVDGEIKEAGETWSPDDDICSICECVAGEVKCTPVCETPVCEEGEVLSYDVPNKCCPRCVKRPDTCQLYEHLDFLYDTSGNCKSISKVNFTFCQGGCGTSTAKPNLVFGDSKEVLDEDCRCCTGEVQTYNEVRVVCGEGVQQMIKTAMLPVIKHCECQQCKKIADKMYRG
jgi:hypothetical protein